MKKNVWIWNHYATSMFFDKAGRHYWFAENLIKQGYNPTIFCASTVHNSDKYVDVGKSKFISKSVDNIPFVFIKTPAYKGNGKSRIKNMLTFYRKLFSVSKDYVKEHGQPDIILASSVHPLTLIAGIKIAKKFGIPCVCEVRDLWPETLVAYGALKRNGFVTKILYYGEKWIYKNADRLIFTMEGGKDYIIDNGWDINSNGPIDVNKVTYINNGVVINSFDSNREKYILDDNDLSNDGFFKIIYTGSIRKANNIKLIIDAAKYIIDNSDNKIKFIIFGDGNEKQELEKYCQDYSIDNVVFKGKVDKKYIPNILSKSNLNILNYSYHDIWKYGGSQNKVFEYLASGRPILSTITMGYDIIQKYNAGISLKTQSEQSIGDAILNISSSSEEKYKNMCENARMASYEFDFERLTNSLIDVIENL